MSLPENYQLYRYSTSGERLASWYPARRGSGLATDGQKLWHATTKVTTVSTVPVIEELSLNGTLLRTIELGAQGFGGPLAYDGFGALWVTDGQNRYMKIDLVEGAEEEPRGIDYGEHIIDIAATTTMVTLACSSGKIFRMAMDRTTIDVLQNAPVSPYETVIPGLAVDDDGGIVIVDCNSNRIVRFDPEGTKTVTYISEGSGLGQMSCPSDVYLDGSDIVVTETGNSRVQRLRWRTV